MYCSLLQKIFSRFLLLLLLSLLSCEDKPFLWYIGWPFISWIQNSQIHTTYTLWSCRVFQPFNHTRIGNLPCPRMKLSAAPSSIFWLLCHQALKVIDWLSLCFLISLLWKHNIGQNISPNNCFSIIPNMHSFWQQFFPYKTVYISATGDMKGCFVTTESLVRFIYIYKSFLED